MLTKFYCTFFFLQFKEITGHHCQRNFVSNPAFTKISMLRSPWSSKRLSACCITFGVVSIQILFFYLSIKLIFISAHSPYFDVPFECSGLPSLVHPGWYGFHVWIVHIVLHFVHTRFLRLLV